MLSSWTSTIPWNLWNLSRQVEQSSAEKWVVRSVLCGHFSSMVLFRNRTISTLFFIFHLRHAVYFLHDRSHSYFTSSPCTEVLSSQSGVTIWRWAGSSSGQHIISTWPTQHCACVQYVTYVTERINERRLFPPRTVQHVIDSFTGSYWILLVSVQMRSDSTLTVKMRWDP